MSILVDKLTAEIVKADEEELRELLYQIGKTMSQKIPYITKKDLPEKCKPFTETEAFEAMERKAEAIAHYDDLAPCDRFGLGRNDMERDLEQCLEAYNLIDIVDLELLWFMRACFGGKNYGKLLLLKYLRHQYYNRLGIDLLGIMEQLQIYMREDNG